MSRDAARRERVRVVPSVDTESVEELGYIQQRFTENRWREGRKSVQWYVHIPASNEVYTCEWQEGASDFKRDDPVLLIHKRDDRDNDDFSGFIVGLHGRKTGLAASVWALNLADLEALLDDDRSPARP